MTKWACLMYYGDQLYSGHYWGDELSLARARRKMVELQRYHPAMRFELTDYKSGDTIKTTVNKQETT